MHPLETRGMKHLIRKRQGEWEIKLEREETIKQQRTKNGKGKNKHVLFLLSLKKILFRKSTQLAPKVVT